LLICQDFGAAECRQVVPATGFDGGQFDLPDRGCYGRTNANAEFSKHSWPSST
jgi:hypothetical protein